MRYVKLVGRPRKTIKKAKKKPVFSKKDWGLIFDRAISMMLVSMVTQALKKGVSMTFEGQPIEEANFLLPPTTVTTTYPKGKTRNPLAGGGDLGYMKRKRENDGTRKGKTRGSD